jgi:hypothetical protein
MITHLTSELNRINQGCKKKDKLLHTDFPTFQCGKDGYLCDECQKEKETLKKVSLMWADFILNYEVKKIYDLVDELKEIQSLMEKA